MNEDFAQEPEQEPDPVYKRLEPREREVYSSGLQVWRQVGRWKGVTAGETAGGQGTIQQSVGNFKHIFFFKSLSCNISKDVFWDR